MIDRPTGRREPIARVLLLAAGVLAGCASAPPAPPPEPYEALAERAADGGPVDVPAIRRAFLDAPDFDARLRRLTELERQLLDAPQHDPLPLGPVGSAALDQYYGSLAGHRVLGRFYRHMELPAQADLHDAWAAAIEEAIASSAEGSRTAPYVALSANEAEAFLDARGLPRQGATYFHTEEHPLLLWVAARAEDGPMRNVYFDLHDAYQAIAARVAAGEQVALPALPPDICGTSNLCENFDITTFLRVLALGDDSAAQTYIGSELALAKEFDESGGWLMQAARADNALAIQLLAELALTRSDEYRDGRRRLWLDRAERWLLQAVEAGFDEAMAMLGQLYLLGRLGVDEDKKAAGRKLLADAAELDNDAAMVILGWAHARDKNNELAERYFLRAADRNERAKMEYVRFLMEPEVDVEFNDLAYRWLRDEARNDNPEAMVRIARLYATGVHVPKRLRRARSWFKRSAKAAPDNPYWVNEVAWRLTVSPSAALRDERFALKIMDRVMADEKNVDARRSPMYLDTWAATFAANGDFERAIAVQKEALAIEQEKPNAESEIIEDLKEHLESFRAGKRIIEEVP